MSGTSSRADIRAELAPYLGQRRKFYATFSHWGKRRVRFYLPGRSVEKMVDTLLFVDLRNEWQRPLSDHFWLTESKALIEARLQQGDTVRFVATVESYSKRDRFADEYSRVEDFKLARAFGFEKVRLPTEDGAQTTLPL